MEGTRTYPTHKLVSIQHRQHRIHIIIGSRVAEAFVVGPNDQPRVWTWDLRSIDL